MAHFINKIKEMMTKETNDDDAYLDELDKYVNQIFEKTFEGKRNNLLNKYEYNVYLVQSFLIDFDENGFYGFFCGETGNQAKETVEALYEVKANSTAKLLKRAINLFDADLPESAENRDLYIEQCDEEYNVITMLEALEDKYYDLEEDIDELTYKYIISNKIEFDFPL